MEDVISDKHNIVKENRTLCWADGADDRAVKRKRSEENENNNYNSDVDKNGDDVPFGGTYNSNNDQSSPENQSTDDQEDVAAPELVGSTERREEKAKSSTLDMLKKLASEGDETAITALGFLDGAGGSAVDDTKQVTSQPTVDVLYGQPTFIGMPEGVMINILQYASINHYRKEILAVERTCRGFRDLLAQDTIWGKIFPQDRDTEYEYATTLRERVFITMSLRGIRKHQKGDKDILLEYLGGADGVRRIVALLLKKIDPSGITCDPEGNCIDRGQYKISLRGDTIGYLTEIIQGHILTKLEKAHRLALGKLRPGDGYPQISATDLRLLDALDHDLTHCSIAQGRHACRTVKCLNIDWMWPLDNCPEEEILGTEARGKLVRALAYRAGVVKMSGEAFSIIETEIVHHLAMVTAHAYTECLNQLPDDPLYVNAKHENAWEFLGEDSEDDELRFEAGMNYYANHCPPLQTDSDGRINYIIIPRLIKNAAVRMGMKPLLGFGEFGYLWTTSNEEEKDKEVEEEMDRYYFEEESEPEPEPEPQSDESSVISLLGMESFDSDGENNTGTNAGS